MATSEILLLSVTCSEMLLEIVFAILFLHWSISALKHTYIDVARNKNTMVFLFLILNLVALRDTLKN